MQYIKCIESNRIEVRRVKWNGEDRLDIRRFFADEGQWYPTRCGIFMPFKMIKPLIKELQKLQHVQKIDR